MHINMKFLIIIPAYNEEESILSCLKSIENQNFQDFYCIVVNDNSTDNTSKIVSSFIEGKNRFSLLERKKNLCSENTHSPGAKVIRAFNFGLNSQDLSDFDIICKCDADVIFPTHYLEEINKVYKKNLKIGMASGLVYIEKNNQWQFENLSSKNHVRGPIKSYRKSCFMEMGGLKEILGWDNIDVMLCKMYGFETLTLKKLWVKHLRPTAYKYKNQKAEKLGEYFYNIGLSFPLAVISSLKSSFRNKSFLEFFITMRVFFKQNSPRVLTEKEIQFIRNLRWQEMYRKWKLF